MATVVLLPGLACDAALWRDQAPALAAAGHAVQVSDVHARFDTLPQMAAALLAETAADAVPLLLAGSSMGGMVALEAARQAPQRIAALALLGTSARADTPELLQLRADAIALFAAGRADEVLRANVPLALHPQAEGHAALVADYLAMIGRAGAAQLIRQNRSVMARADLRAALPAIACPTLVVCGEDDLLTPPEHSREIAAAVPGARLVLLPRCGHLPTWERPREVSALLVQAAAAAR